MPHDERPREKLAARGPSALSDAELIAILLRTGVTGKNVVDLARELLQKFGSLTELSRCSIDELKKNSWNQT
jgi:DNA repair protein RadC